MTNKSRVKTLIIFLFLTIFSFTLYLTSQRTKWDSGWDKGLLSISERNYYCNRFTRIIKNWQQTAHEVYDYNKDQFPESYHTYLIIDLEKKALWVEENGQIRTENYIELSPEAKWSLYHITPNGHTELSERTAIKIRGLAGNLLTPESFRLVGNVVNGYLLVDFNSYYVNNYFNLGSFVMRSVNFQSPTGSVDKIYPSIVVNDDEYKRYHDTIPDSNALVTENKKIKAWNKIEKYLYMEIERQILKTVYRLENISIEPGPDCSAAHAFINIRKKNILEKIKGHRSRNHAFSINIDHLGDDIWYGKSATDLYSDPFKSEENKPVLDTEFLASPNGFIKSSKRKELLKKGREFQLAAKIPESKWKAILPDGKTIEFLGICDNPTVDKQWWGPDGSPLDFAPYMSTESYRVYKENRTCYEIAWRATPGSGTPFIFEGSDKVYHAHTIRDRYGDSVINKMTADSFSFDNSRNVTSLKIGYSSSDWKTALEIKDEQGEIKFLDKYRVMIKPPKFEHDKIVINCYEELSTLMNYVTDFAIVINDGYEIKTISLDEYQRSYSDSRDSGLSTYRYMIDDLDISQIESVIFRYRPYGAIFKNISLVPGQNQGFEIEVIEAEEE